MQHNTPNTPIEVLESEFPIRVLRHEWIADSAGPGAFRGGLGYIKEYELLEDALLTLRLGNSFGSAGWGVLDGSPGARAAAFVIGADGETPLRPLQTVNLKRGDRLRLHMAGGGGYGDPRQRDRDLVVADLRDGYISAAAAADVYGLDPQALAEATGGAAS
jgi:N-methylhydantoinase B